MNMKTITIGIAESKIAQSPDRLATLGLGSCVGLVLYDPVTKICGMVHIMLPSAPKGIAISNKYKFADTAVDELIRRMVVSGALQSRLIAKAAGGAHMFNTSYNLDIMNIGHKNVEMCRQMLNVRRIAIASEDTGGYSGRSIEFDCENNLLEIRTASPRTVRHI